jgi:diguanylate cyclase (GGDEF)-like protein
MNMFTLHVEHAVLLGLFTVLTIINSRLHHGAEGGYWFPAYTLSAFIGAMFVLLRGHGVSEAVSILFGVGFFHLAYLFLQRGLDGFFVRERSSRWPVLLQSAAVLAGVAGLIQFGVVHPNTERRLVFYSMVFAFQGALVAAMMFRKSRGPLAIPGMLMGGLLGALGLSNLVRALLTLREGIPMNYLQSGLTQQMSLLVTTVLQGGITVAFVWMTAAVLHDKLDRLASTDPLTGLLNRRALELAAQREIALSRRDQSPVAAIMIDLDRFKRINDSFGHSFGDRVLLEVARHLGSHMRQSDLLARVGGDEFAVMLHNTSRDEAMEIAERLRRSLMGLVVAEGDVEAQVSASFGLAQADDSTGNWNDLAMKCDKGVYAGKEIGGNLAVAD